MCAMAVVDNVANVAQLLFLKGLHQVTSATFGPKVKSMIGALKHIGYYLTQQAQQQILYYSLLFYFAFNAADTLFLFFFAVAMVFLFFDLFIMESKVALACVKLFKRI
ncbi:hypothetical protein DK880_00507 [Candidatus Cardinium hertigii]|uniref:Uncharacterized protein n=1 Tax=Candidatus Cardinium hertigii TaxID=247481 RepID=A0A2Z3L876_9BACT|nr:hypothetical protein DK880_00507 [Candidatus Cardinium hertigii]